MTLEIIAMVCLIIVVGVSVLSPKLRLATPILLVVIGIGISLIPGVPPIHIPSEWILAGVLPPLLYSSAINLPLVDFRKNFGSISVLSVLLVIVSALITGFVLYTILPDLNLAAAIALGAVISPTDAVAATSIGKRLGLPPRLIAVLEGESLVNDASALVLLRTAIAASAATVAVGGLDGIQSFGAVTLDFAYSSILAIGVGLVVGFVTVFFRSKLHDPVLTTAVSFIIPFLAYIPAEVIDASGVLSVVVAGLYTGHMGAKHFSASTRISERLNWRTIQFLLENGVFLLMGLELKDIFLDAASPAAEADDLNAFGAVLLGVGAALALFLIRFAFVGPLLAVQQARARKRDPDGPAARESTGWRGGLVLTWAGMRGVVTVAAAQSLPEETAYRNQLILIAFTVSILTLVLQGGTLPWIIRVTKLRGVDEAADHAEFATLVDELREAGLQVLEAPEISLPNGEVVVEGVVDRVRNDADLRSESAWERAHSGDGDAAGSAPHRQYRVLRLEVLKAERSALLDARGRGEYSSRILVRAQLMLDQEESRLQQTDGSDAH